MDLRRVAFQFEFKWRSVEQQLIVVYLVRRFVERDGALIVED